jgi:hypothetical protein
LTGAHFIFKSANNDGVYHITCDKGHESYHIDQSLPFQNLFQAGCFALIDGYHREAVSSFAVSLERFFEQIIRSIASKSSAEDSVLQNVWSLVSRQSERQLGAFTYLFLREYSKVPMLLNRNQTEFRNKVTHNGYIPTFEEAVEFGNSVANIQRLNLIDVLSGDEQYWYREFGKINEQKRAKVQTGARIQSMSNPNLILNPFFKKDLEQPIIFLDRLQAIADVKRTLEQFEKGK